MKNLGIFFIALLLITSIGVADDAGTVSGVHGGGYDLELPEGADGGLPPGADCLVLDQLCADNSYGNSVSTLASTYGCDPKCDVWTPSDAPSWTVFEPVRGDTRNYVHGSWNYPELLFTDVHPDGSGERILDYGTLDDTLVRSMRIPFRGGQLYAGGFSVIGSPSGTTGDPWDDSNAVLVVATTPGSSTPLNNSDGCSATYGLQFLDDTYLGDDAYSDLLRDIYCAMTPGNVYYMTFFANVTACGVTLDCHVLLDGNPSGAHTLWDRDPQDESSLLPWEF